MHGILFDKISVFVVAQSCADGSMSYISDGESSISGSKSTEEGNEHEVWDNQSLVAEGKTVLGGME